jgi:hypothetical protein
MDTEAAVTAGPRAHFFDRDIALPAPVSIEGIGDNAPRLRHICGFGACEIEHVNQRL